MPDVPATDTTDDTTPAADAAAPAADDNADPAGAEALGDPGKKALDAMKAARNAERDRRRELEARIAELEKPSGDEPPSADALRAEAQREADARANARIVSAEIRAAAAGKLNDPTDALKYLEASKFEVGSDGAVDTEEIGEAISELITNKPYLAAQSGPRFLDTGDGGARKATGPTQLTRADLAGMGPQDIVKAKAEGRLDNLLSGK